MSPTSNELVAAAKGVIDYVAKEDTSAYEFWRAHAIHFARHILEKNQAEEEKVDAAWLRTLPTKQCDQILWHRKVFSNLDWTKSRCRQLCDTLGMPIEHGQ